MIVKFSTLKVEQLNVLLKYKKLPLSGNKAEKIAKLVEVFGGEEGEVSDDVFEEEFHGFEVPEWQMQMADLRNMVYSLTQSVQQLAVYGAERQIHTDSENSGGNQIASHVETQTSTGMSGALKDYIAVIPDFDPIRKTVTSNQFIDKIEKLKRLHGWADDMVLFAVHHKMKGLAKTWIDALPVMETWADFKRMFLKDFPCKTTIADVHPELMARKRGSSETLMEYYYSMLAIGRKGDLDECSILSYIINGLNDSNLTRTLLAMNLQTCNELLNSFENMSTVMPAKKNYLKGDDENLNRLVNGQNTDRKGPKCYNCNNFGHIAAKCLQPQRKQKCTICLKAGHDAKQCKGKSTVASVENENSTKGCPPIMKQVKLCGKEFMGFVDTGSDDTLITESSVPENVIRQPASKTLNGFGSGLVKTTEMIEDTVTIDNMSTETKIYVVSDGAMPYDMFLGRDVLCKEGQRLTIEGGVLKVQSVANKTFNIGQTVDDEHRIQIRDLLESYHGSFAEDLEKLGRCKSTCMEINVTTDQPIVGKKYQVPFSQRQTLSDIINNLLRYGIIRKSKSPHAASVLLVPKANGES